MISTIDDDDCLTDLSSGGGCQRGATGLMMCLKVFEKTRLGRVEVACLAPKDEKREKGGGRRAWSSISSRFPLETPPL